MTPNEMREARAALGRRWGLGRPVSLQEFAELLRLSGKRPGDTVRDLERAKMPISGPISLAVDLMLAGAVPVGLDAILSRQVEEPVD